jgi:hypothetical protein
MAKKNGDNEQTSLVLRSDNYAIAQYDQAALKAAILDNLEGEELRPTDLTRIKVPASGGKAFTVPSIDSEEKLEKTLQGIIIYNRTARAYWAKGLDEGGGGVPPDCFSSGDIGIGNPGGNCHTCPLNEFGTAKRGGKAGRGKACKEMRVAFLLRPGLMLPDALIIPPSSLASFKRYKVSLTTHAKPITGVVTEIGLAPAKNKDGVEYVSLTFRRVKDLDPESVKHIASYSEGMRTVLGSVAVSSQEEVSG